VNRLGDLHRELAGGHEHERAGKLALFEAMQQRLNTYRSTQDASGFVLYGTLTDQDKTRLSQALQAVAEPLSRVAGKVVNG
jgi:iron uptake system EfeUOB component EfeO/EfeM